MNHYFIFVTKDTGYDVEAERARLSYAKHEIDARVVYLPNCGDFDLNCQMRSCMLLNLARGVWRQDPNACVGMLDADTECRQEPKLLRTFTAGHGDVLVHDGGPDADPRHRYNCGVLAFAPTTVGRCVLKDWAARCLMHNPPVGNAFEEQMHLYNAITEVVAVAREQPRILHCGKQYNWRMESLADSVPPEAIIVHWFLSRVKKTPANKAGKELWRK